MGGSGNVDANFFIVSSDVINNVFSSNIAHFHRRVCREISRKLLARINTLYTHISARKISMVINMTVCLTMEESAILKP